MTEQTPKTTEPLKNPYIAILEETRKKRRGKRSPDNMTRYAFALFCAKLWEQRLPVRFGIDVQKEPLQKFENYFFLGGPLIEEEILHLSAFELSKFKLEERVEIWLRNLELHTKTTATNVLAIDYEQNLFLTCLADIKVNNDGGPESIVYIDKESLDKFAPLMNRWNSLKESYIVDLRASDLIAKVICNFYGVPDDALRILTPDFAKRLRGAQSTPSIDACFFSRFDRRETKKLQGIMATGGFYFPNDLSIITRVSTTAIIDPKKIFDNLQRFKDFKGNDFKEWIKEYSGFNGTFAQENPTLEDFYY